MRTKILKLKRIQVVMIVAIVSVFMSIGLSFLIAYFMGSPFDEIQFVPAVLIPLIVSPFVSWYLIGLLFEIDRIEKTVSLLASIDDLTGLLNRRVFYSSSKSLHEYSKRKKLDYCVLIVDLDFFKQINDNFGHAVGDEVLENFGKTCKELSRSSDLIGRIGGEEFGFFLPDTNLNQAKLFSKRLQKETRAAETTHQGTRIKYTISIGLSESKGEEDTTMGEVLKQADNALYAAKAKGRNRTVVYRTNEGLIA